MFWRSTGTVLLSKESASHICFSLTISTNEFRTTHQLMVTNTQRSVICNVFYNLYYVKSFMLLYFSVTKFSITFLLGWFSPESALLAP